MCVFLPLLFLFLTNNMPTDSAAREFHFYEAGSGAVLVRSAFAHGYRHGYEEGYHLGNIDINMGRQPRTRLSQFHDLSSHYTPEFGDRKSFQSGFEQGVRIGYADGFVGRAFRAVDNLRLIALALDQSQTLAGVADVYFDQGFSTGYNHGLEKVRADDPPGEVLDVGSINCPEIDLARHINVAMQSSFCDGYRRGFALGHADGAVLGPNAAVLAFRK